MILRSGPLDPQAARLTDSLYGLVQMAFIASSSGFV